MSERKKKPEAISSLVANWLGESGLANRIDQAAVIPDWPKLVGPQITANGTLFVAVTTNSWMNELSLLEPELLRSLNSKSGRTPIRRIRWVLGPQGRG